MGKQNMVTPDLCQIGDSLLVFGFGWLILLSLPHIPIVIGTKGLGPKMPACRQTGSSPQVPAHPRFWSGPARRHDEPTSVALGIRHWGIGHWAQRKK